MSSQPEPGAPARSGPVRDPQGLVAGLALLGLALFALWAIGNLPQGTLRAMGPAMLPRWLAIGVGLCGLALVVLAFLSVGETLRRSDYAGIAAVAVVLSAAGILAWMLKIPFVAVGLALFYAVLLALLALALRKDPWLDASGLRGPFFVLAGIVTFALTIRPFPLGGVSTPGLGLIAAGPLAVLIGGHATPEARLRDLLILALSLTAFCMVLFGDLLNLPIPMFPQALSDMLPAALSNDNRLRVMAATLALTALLIFLATRRRTSGAIDVADHAGRL